MKKLAWFVVGTLTVASVGLISVACSTDPVGGGLPTATPTNTADTGTPGKDGGGGGTDGGGGVPDAATCLAKLRPNAAAGPFCPFVPKPDGGVGVNCATGETCCLGSAKLGVDAGFDPSECKAGGATACAPASDPKQNPSNFECTEKDDCATGQVCCIVPFLMALDGGPSAKPGTGTNANKCVIARGENGTRCKATCAANDLQGCQQDSDCTTGTCTSISVGPGDRVQMGYCK
jgi:hypothetical protein